MANLSALNKIIKVQRLLLPINAQNSLLACCSYACTLVQGQKQQRQIYSQAQCTTDARAMRSMSPHSRHYCSKQSPSTFERNKSTTPISIEDFRTREEKREEEFARHAAEEELRERVNTEEEAKRSKVDEIRTKILEAALEHVPTLGWTRNAIIQGAEEAGFPSVVHGMFPEGGFALVTYYYGKCNDDLIKHLQTETQNGKLEVENPVDFLVCAVRKRLEMIIPYKGQWSQALALIALPQNAKTSLAQVLTLVDDICYYSGDRSVDFGWYTRRIGLATIMKMTELYMLQDTSPNHANTWEFLQNRMDEAVQLQMILAQTEDVTNRFQRSFNTAFITARNILGIDYNRR